MTWIAKENEWVHPELGGVRLIEGRGWFFKNFLGEEEGPFPNEDLAKRALEDLWRGWEKHTDTHWRHNRLGEIERLADGRWIGQSSRQRKTGAQRQSADAIIALHQLAKINYQTSVVSVAFTAAGLCAIVTGPALGRLGLLASILSAIAAALAIYMTCFGPADPEASDEQVAIVTGFALFLFGAFADRLANVAADYGLSASAGAGKAVLVSGCVLLLAGRFLEWCAVGSARPPAQTPPG